ncbi:hypothetical protein WDU94_010246 [Cyamophila willieti]
MDVKKTVGHGKKESENSSANEENSKKDSKAPMTMSPQDMKFLELKDYIPMLDLLLAYLTSKEPDNNIVKKVKNILNTLNSPKVPPTCDLITLERIEGVVKTLKTKMAPKLQEFGRQQSLLKSNKPSTPTLPKQFNFKASSINTSSLTLETIDLTGGSSKKITPEVPSIQSVPQVQNFLSSEKIKELREKMQKRKATLDEISSDKHSSKAKSSTPHNVSLCVPDSSKATYDTTSSSKSSAVEMNKKCDTSKIIDSSSKKHVDPRLHRQKSFETDSPKPDTINITLKSSHRLRRKVLMLNRLALTALSQSRPLRPDGQRQDSRSSSSHKSSVGSKPIETLTKTSKTDKPDSLASIISETKKDKKSSDIKESHTSRHSSNQPILNTSQSKSTPDTKHSAPKKPHDSKSSTVDSKQDDRRKSLEKSAMSSSNKKDTFESILLNIDKQTSSKLSDKSIDEKKNKERKYSLEKDPMKEHEKKKHEEKKKHDEQKLKEKEQERKNHDSPKSKETERKDDQKAKDQEKKRSEEKRHKELEKKKNEDPRLKGKELEKKTNKG